MLQDGMTTAIASDDSGDRARRFYRKGNEWFFGTSLQSDITVKVDGILYHLHKFPLISKCGKIERIVEGLQDVKDDTHVLLEGCPGGSDAFLIAAKFCYEITVDFKPENILVVYLAADFLEMTEEYSDDNMLVMAQNYINKEIILSWKGCISALRSSQNGILVSENLPIVDKCLVALSVMACRDPSLIGRPEIYGSLLSPGGSILWNGIHTGATVRSLISDWWFEDTSSLSFPIFKKFIETIKKRGIKSLDVSGALMFYAMEYLPGLDRWLNRRGRRTGRWSLTPEVVDQKVLTEGIVELLPENKGKLYCRFLLGILRLAMILEADLSCKESLERKIGIQLELATLDGLMIPNFSGSDDLYDIDCVERIIQQFVSFQSLKIAPSSASSSYPAIPLFSSPVSSAARLLDDYVAEVASDVNLKPQKIQSLLESFPDYLRELDDGIYRALDIYFKEHTGLQENEREQLCRIMNCQKLSTDACVHALQNSNLPLRVVLQVLFSEQQQLRGTISNYLHTSGNANNVATTTANSNTNVIPGNIIERESWVSVARENQYLRVNMDRMQSKVTELENQFMSMKKYMGWFSRRSMSR